MSGIQLDIDHVETKEDDKYSHLGPEIKCEIDLPSGQFWDKTFRLGMTVGYVKVQVSNRLQLPYDDIDLYFNGKLMPDPLSLSDFPKIKNSDLAVLVVKNLKADDRSDSDAEN